MDTAFDKVQELIEEVTDGMDEDDYKDFLESLLDEVQSRLEEIEED
jgi:hypothetical protein